MSGGPARVSRAARGYLRFVGRLVPRWRRQEWLEEWEGELSALVGLRRASAGAGYPGVARFLAGALPHVWSMWKEEWTMTGWVQDLRHAVRVLGRAPGFAVVAALTLALGIGANASMFTLVNGLLFRTAPKVEAPERLVQIARSYTSAPRWDNWSYPALQEIRQSTEGSVFEGVAGYTSGRFVIGRGAEAESVSGLYVTGNWFDVVGVEASLGRTIEVSDDVLPGGRAVAVLGHRLWMRRFGGDRGVVGTTVPVGGRATEIIGIAPEGFAGIETVSAEPEMYVPISTVPVRPGRTRFDQWGSSWIYAVGRLAPGTSFEAARAAMPVVWARLRAAWPQNEDIEVLLAQGVGLDPEARAQARTISMLLLGIAALVLLLTCANVANLFLARATSRAPEMGLRLALGAGRGRVARQVLTESVLLSLFGAVLAYPIVRVAAELLPHVFPYRLAWTLTPDARVVAALLGLGVLAGLLFGALPSIAAGRGGALSVLNTSRSTGSVGHTRIRDALVVVQLAVSLGLMTAAGLLGRSVRNAGNADPGFDAHGVVVAFVNPAPTGRYDAQSALVLFGQLLDDVRALPGVTSATLATEAPFIGPHSRATRVPLERMEDEAAHFEAEEVYVGPDYFSTLRIPVLRGRPLRGWREEPEPVVVINEAAARFWWPGEDPIGKRLTGERVVRVVGVVADAQYRSLRNAAPPAVYLPMPSTYDISTVIHVRTARPLSDIRPALRGVVENYDPGLPVTTVADLHAAVAGSIGETRTFGLLVSTFAGLAFLLSVIGLYGLVSYAVSRRVREMGIRMALGAEPRFLVRMVVGHGLSLAAFGIVLGLGVAWAVGRGLQGFLFGVSATNAAAPLAASIVLLGAAGLAAWLPARRAGGVDAVNSLRE
ncbi:MAG: ABC transporter permease [Gemmatimonadota bacterium]|jgi:predicted permease